jgi:hypothetical protein
VLGIGWELFSRILIPVLIIAPWQYVSLPSYSQDGDPKQGRALGASPGIPPRPKSRRMNGRYIVMICFFVLSCSSGEGEATLGKFLFLEKAEEQQTSERVWKPVSVSRLFELPVEEEIMLYNPLWVVQDTNGDVYVVDYGAYQIFRFDSKGNYIMSYGSGAGSAPGEFVSIASVEVASDSLIYVTDPNNARISSFSKATGRLIDSRTFDRGEVPRRHAITDTGIEYFFRAFNEIAFKSNFRDGSVEFGDLVEGDRFVSHLVTAGMIETYKDRMIYVPARFPVIMVYDVNGSLVRAKKTMTLDRFEEPPQLVRYVMNGIESYKIEGDRVNSIRVSVVGDELLLQSTSDSEDLIVDVYEAGSVEYKYSFRLDYYPAYITNDRIYQLTRDGTVIVHSINRPS